MTLYQIKVREVDKSEPPRTTAAKERQGSRGKPPAPPGVFLTVGSVPYRVRTQPLTRFDHSYW